MIKDFIEQHWNSNRLLLGNGSSRFMTEMEYPMYLYSYPSNKRVMTWRIPEEWVVREAYIKDEQGNRYLDYKDDPLHLVAYSTPIDKWVDWTELEGHLYWNTSGYNEAGYSIPWEFKYYERDWGFCCTEEWWDCADRHRKYHVVIDAEYKQGTMLVGELQLGNIGVSDLVIMSHYDHPYQANDGLSGVAVALEVYRRLIADPPNWFSGVRFLFVPETIGSIAYFSDHDYTNISGGLFLDACGNGQSVLNYQTSSMWSVVDDVIKMVLKEHYETSYGTEHPYNFFNIKGRGEIPGNDEIVLCSLGIPCVALNRFPYPQYHTSADTINIIDEGKLQEVADITEDMVRMYCTNYKPLKKYEGIPFLSGYGLWVDWRKDKELNSKIEEIFMRFDGKQTISRIADDLDMDYWVVRGVVDDFRTAGLIEAVPITKED